MGAEPESWPRQLATSICVFALFLVLVLVLAAGLVALLLLVEALLVEAR